jgi:hypothetical protein
MLDKQKGYYKEISDKISFLIEDILFIYEEAEGEPNHTKALNCPVCNNESTIYGCLWYGNKHVHFYCKNCDLNVRQ